MTAPRKPADTAAVNFARRHIGPSPRDIASMLEAVGARSLDALMAETLPSSIRQRAPLDLGTAMSETEALAHMRELASQNRVFTSMIGQGYSGTILPAVIQRNILENPAWYTAYTPYQPEISQGRLEALFNFQTMICDLTGLDVANASLLDEATAAAEAMALAERHSQVKTKAFFVDKDVHPQTLAVLRTRAEPLGWSLIVGDPSTDLEQADVVGGLLQYPGTSGALRDPRAAIAALKAKGAVAILAADLLALTLVASPGELGADIAIGSAQRFGVPMGYGGPHAAYMAVRDALKRSLPGRIVGLSVDSRGMAAYRLALQTREQHIRREKATSNICTSQVLLAVTAALYAVYHGPGGLRRIAGDLHTSARRVAATARAAGLAVRHEQFFDTVAIEAPGRAAQLVEDAHIAGLLLRLDGPDAFVVSLGEGVTEADLENLAQVLGAPLAAADTTVVLAGHVRGDDYLTHPVFEAYHSETEMMRYLRAMADRDFALDRGMIPLGSCTMKLNATSEM
ncbi:MAG: glycine dehydrogenase (aminomethyl-transferring), partial [Bradyrhizobium sp.]|nr:glycine dehydrogenase (aminomethyl-transferring) [Bradyrhizobium sp.]